MILLIKTINIKLMYYSSQKLIVILQRDNCCSFFGDYQITLEFI